MTLIDELRVVVVVVLAVMMMMMMMMNDFCFPVFCLVLSVAKEYLIVYHSDVCKRLMEFSKKFHKISGQK